VADHPTTIAGLEAIVMTIWQEQPDELRCHPGVAQCLRLDAAKHPDGWTSIPTPPVGYIRTSLHLVQDVTLQPGEWAIMRGDVVVAQGFAPPSDQQPTYFMQPTRRRTDREMGL
jgi:hypothetical protein